MEIVSKTSNRVVFIIAPMGQGKEFFIDHADKIFNIELEGKRVFFKFGAVSRMDLDADPFDRIILTINEHLTYFRETTFVYYGWELAECIDRLYEHYKDCEFFVTFKNKPNYKRKLREALMQRSKTPLDPAKLEQRIVQQYEKVETFLKDKTVEIFHVDKDVDAEEVANGNNNRYSCFVTGLKNE